MLFNENKQVIDSQGLLQGFGYFFKGQEKIDDMF